MATPMLDQYNRVKEKYKDTIVFFRLGDFYEMFDQDALFVSELLDLTLTHRNSTPMCGVPHHSAMPYIKKLLEKGYKIAVCEQMATAGNNPKLVERAVTEVYTPGMVLEDELLGFKENNFLMLVQRYQEIYQLAYVDYSTGFLGVSFSRPNEGKDFLYREVLRLSPKEILLQEELYDEPSLRSWLSGQVKRIGSLPEWHFDRARATQVVLKHFRVSHLRALGFSEVDSVHIPLGVLLGYLGENMASISHLKSVEIYTGDNSLFMDEATIRNLELTRSIREGESQFSLLSILDHTKTAMGLRLLRNWLLSPSINKKEIEQRLEALEYFKIKPSFLQETRQLLASMKDLERLSVRLCADKAHARDLRHIAQTLEKVGELQNLLLREGANCLSFISSEQAKDLEDLHAQLVKAISAQPATTFNVGGLIASGYNQELDRLRDLEKNGKLHLRDYWDSQKAKTGIPSLKLKYNKVIGYHFEISKNQSDMAPEYFIKRQTFLSGVRFTTEQLAYWEQEILTAGDKALALERELFFSFRDSIKDFSSLLLDIAHFIALWDVYSNLAYVALQQNFVRPLIKDMCEGGLVIEKGRHPVVEYYSSNSFVANDLSLYKGKGYFSFVTGPNMAGKSTYLRQIALIVLLAQIGSYVPAARAEIALVDKIFCRVGASDNLARGESTFLVEMNETSFILRKAGPYSLVILDEVGRGTSTYDGLAIAWAVCEYLLEQVKSFTLFATHYHELASLKDPRIRHLSLSVKTKGDEIIFLRHIEEKPSLSSYGIAVAKLAGLPLPVIARAKELLAQLQNSSSSLKVKRSLHKEASLLDLEEIEKAQELIKQLKVIDAQRLTPLEALGLVNRWKEQWPE